MSLMRKLQCRLGDFRQKNNIVRNILKVKNENKLWCLKYFISNFQNWIILGQISENFLTRGL